MSKINDNTLYQAKNIVLDGKTAIDTGILMFDGKDWEIMCKSVYHGGGAGANLSVLFGCLRETSPYPGFYIWANQGHARQHTRGYASPITTNIPTSEGTESEILFTKTGDIYTLSADGKVLVSYSEPRYCYTDTNGYSNGTLVIGATYTNASRTNFMRFYKNTTITHFRITRL